MAEQGKQMRVGACKGFAYHSVKLVYWLIVTGMRLLLKRFPSGETLYAIERSP
jgi:hypothetical protein